MTRNTKNREKTTKIETRNTKKRNSKNKIKFYGEI